MKSASKSFWELISLIFHPLLLITGSIWLLFEQYPYYKARYFEEETNILLFFIFANTFVMPTIAVLILKRLGLVESIYLKNQKDRLFPFLITSIFCFFTAWQLHESFIGELAFRYILAIGFSIFILSFINIKKKLSAHATGCGGVIALLSYIVIYLGEGEMAIWLIGSIFFAGLVLSSRLYLKAHTTSEIYLGFLLGFSIIFCSVAL